MGQGTSNQSFLLFIATCTFVGPQDLICKGQVCPGQVSGAFDFTLNCVVPVPQIWGIINSIAPTAAFFFFSITTYFALSATVSVLSLWPVSYGIRRPTIFKTWNGIFYQFGLLFWSWLWWLSKHRQAPTDLPAGSGCRCGKAMKKVWSQRREVRPHPGLPAPCRLAVLAAAWATAEPCSLGPRPGPQQSLHLICICLSNKVLFHVNGLEAGPHFFQKVFC